MSDVTYAACPYCSKTFALPSDSRIRELEARLAACVGALENIGAWICDKELCGHFTAEEIRAECAVASSPDLAPWRELIEALRRLDAEWNDDTVGDVRDAVVRCNL